MNRYRVPKKRVPVRVSLRHEPEEPACIFIAERAAGHRGPERPSDVMNSPEPFLAIEREDGTLEFVRRRAVAFLAVPAPMELEEGVAEGQITSFELMLRLDDQRRLDGVVRYQLPEAARRLQDILNLSAGFLSLERAGEVLLVNKHRIVSVRVSNEGGSPSESD